MGNGDYPWPELGQLEGGSGRNNCLQASLGAYLLAAGLLPRSLGQHEVLDRVSRLTRGTPDLPVNAETSWPQAQRGVEAFGLPWVWTASWGEAMTAAWSILLVDGAAVTRKDGRKPYPASWFDGSLGADHFVLSGPLFGGSYDWLMNPLDPVSPWAEYDLDTVAPGFGGGVVLPPLLSASSGVLVTALRAAPLLRAPAPEARPAIGQDRAPVQVKPLQTLQLAGVPWRNGYVKFVLPRSPVWGWYLQEAVHWGPVPG